MPDFEKREIPVERAQPDAATQFIYTNFIAFGATPVDVNLQLGVVVPRTAEAAVVAVVQMSWEQAYALRALLTAGIENYEKEWGSIRDVTRGGTRITQGQEQPDEQEAESGRSAPPGEQE
jgi:hypothetical protein